jgi:hypothetical protein
MHPKAHPIDPDRTGRSRYSDPGERKHCFAVSLLLILLGPALAGASELMPETLAAWNRYIEQAKSRMSSRLNARNHFLWADEDPDRARRLRKGEILVTPVNGTGQIEVPNGLIHDWQGAAFFPDVTIESVFATTDQYACYKHFYKPLVIESRLLSRDEKQVSFSMRWLKKALWISAVMEADYQANYFRRDDSSGYGFVWSTRIQDVVNYGTPSEHLLPPGTGSGFVWRLFSISRFREQDGGVYVELEAIVLSRPIPARMGWLVNPVVRRLSQSSLLTSLGETYQAVRSLPKRTDPCVSQSREMTARSAGR